ncbi:MAG: CRISPR-associated protein [Thermoproteus sp.]
MRYYTPGHGLVADSLIMHGFVKLVHVSGSLSGRVRRLGERFEMEADQVDWDRYREWELHEFVKVAVDRDVDVGPLEDLRRSAIDVAGFPTWKKRLKEALDVLPTVFDLSVDHAERFKEGRRKGGKGYTLYLPISLTFGKYNVVDYSVMDSAYTVCPSCFALATLGYIYGATKVRIGAGNDFVVYNIAAVPGDELNLVDLVALQRLAGLVEIWGGERAGKGINALGALVYALSFGETVMAVERPIDFVVWRTERSGNNQRAMAEGIYRGRRLLEALARLKLYFPRWPNAVRRLSGDVLNAVGEYLVFGGDAYAVVRDIVRDLRSDKRGGGGSRAFDVEPIAKVLLSLQSQ